MLLCLGEHLMRFLFLCCCCSFFMCIFICQWSSFCCCIFIWFPGYFAMSPALHPGFSGPWRPPPALSSTPTTFDCLFFFIYRERYGFEWAFFTHRRFLPYAPSQASLGAGNYSSKFAGLHTDPRNTDLAHLFVWFTVIHNLLYILNLYLCMLIMQKFYLWKLW